MSEELIREALSKYAKATVLPTGGPTCCSKDRAWAWVELVAGLCRYSEEARKVFPDVMEHALEVSRYNDMSPEHIDIIAESAYNSPQDQEDAEAGFLSYWNKTHPRETDSA